MIYSQVGSEKGDTKALSGLREGPPNGRITWRSRHWRTEAYSTLTLPRMGRYWKKNSSGPCTRGITCLTCITCMGQTAMAFRAFTWPREEWKNLKTQILKRLLVTCRLLNELATKIVPLFCQSLRDSQVPSDWRNADVPPVFKRGNRNLVEYYKRSFHNMRLFQTFRTYHNFPYSTHLDQHKILSAFQHCFRKCFSCQSQLFVKIQELLSPSDQNIQIDMTVLDFSQAFDTVLHKRLLGSWVFYGIEDPVLSWIQAFLEDRVQCCKEQEIIP